MTKRNLWIIIGAVIVIAAIVIGIRLAQKPAPKEQVIKIGSVLSLTGSASVWGQKSKNGVELAVKHLAEKGIKVDVIFEDAASESKTAVSALNKLLAQGIKYIVGDISSGNVLAMAPIAERNKVVLISPGASNPDISKAGDFIFRTWQSDALEARYDAEYAFKVLNWKDVCIVYIQNAYGEGLKEAFKKHFLGKIVLEESFSQGQSSFRDLIIKLKKIKVDGIYLPGYPEEMGLFLKQLREQGVLTPILSTQAFDDPIVLKRAGSAAEGVIFSVPEPPDPSNPVVQRFRKDYKRFYGEEPGVTADAAYDAVMILVETIRKVGDDPEKVKNALYSIDLNGASGRIKFDENGDLIKNFVFKIVRNGQFVTLEKEANTYDD